jgi:hypothetical protein
MKSSMVHGMRSLGLSLALLGLLLVSGCFRLKPPPAAEKAATPDADELAAKEKEIDDLFKDLDKEDQPRVYLDKGEKTKDDPVGRYALLNRARAAAANQGDMKRAFQAIDLLAKDWDVNPLAMKRDVLATLGKVMKDPDDQVDLTKQTLQLIDESVAADDYEVANSLASLGEGFCQKATATINDGLKAVQAGPGGSRDKIQSFKDFLEDLKAIQAKVETAKKRVLETEKEFDAVKDSQETLKEKPDDPDASLAWGKFLCFIKGNWDKGLPLLAKSNDEDLKPLAKKDLDKQSTTKDQVELADTWWDLADKEQGVARMQLKRRALFWYKKVENSVRGLTQEKVKKRISEVERVS